MLMKAKPEVKTTLLFVLFIFCMVPSHGSLAIVHYMASKNRQHQQKVCTTCMILRLSQKSCSYLFNPPPPPHTHTHTHHVAISRAVQHIWREHSLCLIHRVQPTETYILFQLFLHHALINVLIINAPQTQRSTVRWRKRK